MLRKLARVAYNVLAASLLLCVAVCVLWVRSRTTVDGVYFTGPAGRLWDLYTVNNERSGGAAVVVGTVGGWPEEEPVWRYAIPTDALHTLSRVRHNDNDFPTWPERPARGGGRGAGRVVDVRRGGRGPGRRRPAPVERA